MEGRTGYEELVLGLRNCTPHLGNPGTGTLEDRIVVGREHKSDRVNMKEVRRKEP